MNKAVFLDKDGTLIPNIPYNVVPELITLEDNSIDGLKQLYQQGYLLIIISNQSGVAHGYFTEEKLTQVEDRLQYLLAPYHIRLTAFYYCPHHPNGTVEAYSVACDCRKPMPGMLLRAAANHHIDLSKSWMVGDILNDVEAGNRAGCKTILIDNENETEWLSGEYRAPTNICKTIDQAAQIILDA